MSYLERVASVGIGLFVLGVVPCVLSMLAAVQRPSRVASLMDGLVINIWRVRGRSDEELAVRHRKNAVLLALFVVVVFVVSWWFRFPEHIGGRS